MRYVPIPTLAVGHKYAFMGFDDNKRNAQYVEQACPSVAY